MHQNDFYINISIFLKVCWINGDIPEEERTAIFIPIHKKKEIEIIQIAIEALSY